MTTGCLCPSPCCFPAPCSSPPLECPTMACCTQRCLPPSRKSGVCDYNCPEPCRARMKPCNKPAPCCLPFPCFPKICCPCCVRPDPSLKRRCILPSPLCAPQACSCGKLCLIPKHCPKFGCCAPIPICPPCNFGVGSKSLYKPVPINPPVNKKETCSCPSACTTRHFVLQPQLEGQFMDPNPWPKRNTVVLHCPFKLFQK